MLDEVPLSDSARDELSLALGQLRWLDVIGRKGRLREHLLVHRCFERMGGWTDDLVAATLTKLLLALSERTDEENMARELRRLVAACRKYRNLLRQEIESERSRAVR